MVLQDKQHMVWYVVKSRSQQEIPARVSHIENIPSYFKIRLKQLIIEVNGLKK